MGIWVRRALPAIFALSTSAVAGPLVNADFESGSLTGWTLSRSYGQAVDATFGVPPLQGNYSALVVSRSGNSCPGEVVGDPWSAQCPSPPIPFPSAPATSTPLPFAPAVTGNRFNPVFLSQQLNRAS